MAKTIPITSAGFNVFGHFIPDTYCTDIVNGTQDNFTNIQAAIMMPRSDDNPMQHNCQLANGTKCDTFVFDKSLMNETIATQFGLFCSKANINSLLTSIMAITNTIAPIPVNGILL